MANRTYKVLGKCYSSDIGSVEVEFFVNGDVLFSGTVVATVESPIPDRIPHDELVELFSFELPDTVTGQIPMKINVTGGDCFFSSLSANYSGYRAKWTDESSPATVIESVTAQFINQTYDPPHADNKTNVKLDNVDITATVNLENVDQPDDTTGWHYVIPADSELSLDYYIDPMWVVSSIPTSPPTDTYPVTVINRRGEVDVVVPTSAN